MRNGPTATTCSPDFRDVHILVERRRRQGFVEANRLDQRPWLAEHPDEHARGREPGRVRVAPVQAGHDPKVATGPRLPEQPPTRYRTGHPGEIKRSPHGIP